MISQLEKANAAMWQSGMCDAWFQNADMHTRSVAGRVNGPLFEKLLRAAGYCDSACVDMFRYGAPMVGELERSGVGEPIVGNTFRPWSVLSENRMRSNAALVDFLRVVDHADELLALTQKDAELGRMRVPVPFGPDVPDDMFEFFAAYRPP